MRDFLNILEGRTVLTEAPDYLQMFAKVIAEKPVEDSLADLGLTPEQQDAYNQRRSDGIKESILEEIKWAKKILRRQDRIIWYLRLYRLRYLSTNPAAVEAEMAVFAKKGCDDVRDVKTYAIPNAGNNWRTMKTSLEHFSSMFERIPNLETVVFEWQSPNTVFTKLYDIENQWKQKRKGAIAHNEEDTVYIQFTDGFAWVLLDRASCDEEGDAMGHCGNRGSPKGGDRILSLRKPIMIDNEKHWQPSLTFILKRDGMLGEMKGKGNEKPAERYHRYIITLLESDIVKGIVGGGYMPQNNFSMSDLPEEDADRLMEKKPDLATFLFYYRKNGIDDVLVKKINDHGFGPNGTPFYGFDETKRYAKIGKYNNVYDFFEEHGTRDAKYAISIMNGEEEVNVHSYRSESERKDVWNDSIEDDVKTAIGRYMMANHPDDVSTWEENNDEDFEPDNHDAVLEIIEELQDDWVDALDNAYLSGQQAGTESEVYETFEKRADDWWELSDGSTQGMLIYARHPSTKLEDYNPTTLIHDTECWLAVKAEDFMKMISEMDADDIDNEGWLREEPDIAQPHYGWSGYSEEAASDHFTDHCPDYSKYQIEPEQAKAA